MSAVATAVQAMEALSRLGLEKGAFPSRSAVDAALAEQGLADPRVRAFVCTNLVPTRAGAAQGAWRWRCDVPGIAQALHVLSAFDTGAPPGATFQGQALFIAGRKSGYVQEQQHRDAIFKYFPRAKVTYMEHCGHWLHAEDPTGFCQLLTEFIL